VAISALLFAVSIAPWMIRNRVVFGHWIFIRGNAPFEFTLGNYHFSNGLGWYGKHPTQNKWEYAKYERMGEVAYIAEKKQAAFMFVKQYPLEFRDLCLKRFVAFWTGSEFVPDLWPRWLFSLISAFMLLGLIVALAYRAEGAGLYFWLISCYPVTYYLIFPQARYRHAIEPEMLLLGTYFVYLAIRDLSARFAVQRQSQVVELEPA
jgi:hypothetical protein